MLIEFVKELARRLSRGTTCKSSTQKQNFRVTNPKSNKRFKGGKKNKRQNQIVEEFLNDYGQENWRGYNALQQQWNQHHEVPPKLANIVLEEARTVFSVMSANDPAYLVYQEFIALCEARGNAAEIFNEYFKSKQ